MRLVIFVPFGMKTRRMRASEEGQGSANTCIISITFLTEKHFAAQRHPLNRKFLLSIRVLYIQVWIIISHTTIIMKFYCQWLLARFLVNQKWEMRALQWATFEKIITYDKDWGNKRNTADTIFISRYCTFWNQTDVWHKVARSVDHR